MNELENWLRQATRHLSASSAAQVRTEIHEHCKSASEAGQSERLAVEALGDAKTANFQHRRVLLTSAETRMLREGNWEARAVCARPWLKRLLLAVPAVALAAALALLLTGSTQLARVLLVAATGTGLMFAAPFLPVYTRSRSRVFRCVKWIVLIGTIVLALGPDALKWSWLFASCLWPVVWIELTRDSIRRKLPIAHWPRHLYL